jgi:bifunctional non-homologous end joining protein LigD
MLAETAEAPFSGPDWVFELKVDGYRALVHAGPGGAVSLRYRSGTEALQAFPDLAEPLRAIGLRGGGVVLDGEVAVLDARGRPSFQRLQKRAQRGRARGLDPHTAADLPALYFAFDLLAAGGRDLRGLPLLERKRLLSLLLGPQADSSAWAGRVKLLGHADGKDGVELFRRAQLSGLEGVMGKRAASPYRGGRRGDWRKVKVEHTSDFAIVGFARGEGMRTSLGSVHLGLWDGQGFVFVGSAGSGFAEAEAAALARRLEAWQVKKPLVTGALPKGKENVWVEPLLVAEVRYKERTDDGVLRQPVFLRLREDKTPLQTSPIGEPVTKSVTKPVTETSLPPAPAAVSRAQRFTNLTKPLWPEEGITKGDLISYYRTIAPWILPWLRDRPVTITRYPDGIAGKSFFQKNAPDHTPDWVRVAVAPSERWGGATSAEKKAKQEQREAEGDEGLGDHIHAIVVDEVDTLLYLANLASIQLHIPAARLQDVERPDYGVVDLDPKGAPFADVRACALELRTLCDSLGLPSFVKTSGQAGLHILVPLGAQLDQAAARQLCELLARLVEQRLPKISTLHRPIDKRQGRVYLDTLQNGRGKTIAGAYSVRPVPGASASAPLLWDEVDERLDPKAFTLRTLPERAQRLGADPCEGALSLQPDLPRALALLAERLKA